jgi:hypothetical protein
LEELLPKDNENIPFLGPVEPSEPQGFSAEQMIRCEECLRANPPTRVICLYCTAPLPVTESSARLRKPVLHPPEKHQQGYNNILLPMNQAVEAEVISEAAALLKLTSENIEQILSQRMALPVARTASRQESEIVLERLTALGLSSISVSDVELGLSSTDNPVKHVRAMSIQEEGFTIHQAGGVSDVDVSWTEVVLILPARLIENRVELKERKSRRSENEILDLSEFFRDDVVIDLYSSKHRSTWRVNASGFDFSCLGNEKALIATENIGRLQRMLASYAVKAQLDDSYQRVRGLLELAWSTQPETQSSGWRRERPGKLSVGIATIRSNESQFTRYSRLRYYLL